MRLGQFLFTILIALALFALIGIVDWSTVGDWALIMLVLALLGPVLLIISYLVLKVKDNSEVINRRLGIFFNWVIVISGIVIFILIVTSQINTDDDYRESQITIPEKNESRKPNQSNSTGQSILERPLESEQKPSKSDLLGSGLETIKKTDTTSSAGIEFLKAVQEAIPKYQGYDPYVLRSKALQDKAFFNEISLDFFENTMTEEERVLYQKDRQAYKDMLKRVRTNILKELTKTD